jgi:D-arabinose 1-dehydrogenase-like Zn-dependent alcohol dehydrogenase
MANRSDDKSANLSLGSSATANIVAQLAKHLQLRVIKVVDVAKHGARLSEGPADLIVDSHDPERAVSIIRKVTDGSLRFGVDTVGKPTAELLRRTLHSGDEKSTSHLVGLTGLPKEAIIGVKQHTVPIKIHHEVPAVGEALMVWLEKLLATGKIVPPDVELLGGGLAVVNNGLDRMRRGEISGKRLAVSLI